MGSRVLWASCQTHRKRRWSMGRDPALASSPASQLQFEGHSQMLRFQFKVTENKSSFCTMLALPGNLSSAFPHAIPLFVWNASSFQAFRPSLKLMSRPKDFSGHAESGFLNSLVQLHPSFHKPLWCWEPSLATDVARLVDGAVGVGQGLPDKIHNARLSLEFQINLNFSISLPQVLQILSWDTVKKCLEVNKQE